MNDLNIAINVWRSMHNCITNAMIIGNQDINLNKVYNTTTDKIEVVPGASYTDLKITCTLGYNEPSDADAFDTSTTNDGSYVFDELGLLSYADDINDSIMLTHVVFHPVQKSQNREIEIVYTVRIQLN